MKLQDIYQSFIASGIAADPRGRQGVEDDLAARAKKYQKMTAEEKEFFDQEALTNPYYDTRILYGEKNLEVSAAIAGIDMETQELLLVDRLKEKGEHIDLVISHHPEGRALGALNEVLKMKYGILTSHGVLPNIAEGILEDRIDEVRQSLSPGNHERAVRAAELLKLPFICVHTPADNSVETFVSNLLKDAGCLTLQDIIDVLLTIPEYRHAAHENKAPYIAIGKEDRSAGKIVVDFTAGTTGSVDEYARLSSSGISTVVTMYAPKSHQEAAKKEHVNIIVAGHMSSDSIGLNLVLDKIERQGVSILPASGFIRFSRN